MQVKKMKLFLNVSPLTIVHLLLWPFKVASLYEVPVKSKVKMSQNCVAFSEYVNFTNIHRVSILCQKYCRFLHPNYIFAQITFLCSNELVAILKRILLQNCSDLSIFHFFVQHFIQNWIYLWKLHVLKHNEIEGSHDK